MAFRALAPRITRMSRPSRAVIAARPDRVVWGSNWPHPNAPEPKPVEVALLDLLRQSAPDAAIYLAMLVDNAARL